MGANVLILARNLQYGFDSCSAFRAWPVEQNSAGKFAKMAKVAIELYAGKNDLADRSAAQGVGLLRRPDETVASALWTVSVRPMSVPRLGRVAA